MISPRSNVEWGDRKIRIDEGRPKSCSNSEARTRMRVAGTNNLKLHQIVVMRDYTWIAYVQLITHFR
jgi:hypothetical protein